MRPATLDVVDNQGNVLLNLKRHCRCDTNCCCAGCCCCFQGCWCFCLQKMTVTRKDGKPIGTIQQTFGMAPSFSILLPDDTEVLTIRGPYCLMNCYGNDIEFEVLSADREHLVGIISNTYQGVVKDTFSSSDNYYLTFPEDLEINCKALIVAATILLDYMYFETNNVRKKGAGKEKKKTSKLED